MPKNRPKNNPPLIDLRAMAKYKALMGDDDPDNDGDPGEDDDFPEGFVIEPLGKDGVQDMYVYCPIGNYQEFDYDEFSMKQIGLTAGLFAKEWRELQASGATRVRMYFNSPGGDVFDGAAIYNLIARSKIPVDAYVDGTALSIASMIVMACDKVYMGETSWLMLHNPWACTVGNVQDHEKTIATLETLKKGMAVAYTRKSGLKPDAIDAIMNSETWLTAQDAKEQGLCDDIVDPKNAQARCDFKRFAAMYQHTPENIHEFFKAAAAVRPRQNPQPPVTGEQKEIQAMAEKTPITLDILRSEYPEVFAAAVKAGADEAVKAERVRIQTIRASAFDGQDTLVNELIDGGAPVDQACVKLVQSYKAAGTSQLTALEKETADSPIMPAPIAPKAEAKELSEDEQIKRWTNRYLAEGKDPVTAERMARRAVAA